MTYNPTRSLRKVKQALVVPALVAAVIVPAAPALAAGHARHHARPTRTAHVHSGSQAGNFHTDGRKVG